MPEKKDGIPEMDLDQVMKDGMEKFDEELVEAASKGPSIASDKADETASQAKPEEKKDTSAVKPEETKPEAEKAPEAEPSGEKTEEGKPPEKKRLFKDQDEAEERYKELQRTMSKAGEEKRELVERLRAKEESETLKAAIDTADKDYRTFLKKRMKETTDAIDKLDPDADDYDDKVADLRAEEQGDIRGYERQHPEVYGEAVVRRPSKASPPSNNGAPPSNREAMVSRIGEIMTESKVEWGTDDPVFMSFARQAEKADAQGNPIPFDQQVKTAIERTNAHYGNIIEKRIGGRSKTAEEEAAAAQGRDLPLGRGAAGGKGIAMEKESDMPPPVSIDSALENLSRERTL